MFEGKKVPPKELRVAWEEAWTEKDQRWAEQRTMCSCKHPVPGPRYFKSSDCNRCGGHIPRLTNR